MIWLGIPALTISIATVTRAGRSPRAPEANRVLWLESSRRLRLFRSRIKEGAIPGRVKRHPQLAMIIIVERNEAEGLHARALIGSRRLQHFSHASDGAGAGVESDLHEVACGHLLL